MAEAIAFDIAAGLITKLGSLVLSQIGLWWNLKDDLHDLKSTISAIKAVLLDAEEQSVSSNLVKDWLEKLKDALYDADDLLDDFFTQALRKDVMSGNKLRKEVRVFFSSSNQFAYGLKMGRKIKAIKARFTSIQSQSNGLHLVPRDRLVETTFMAKRREEGHSFVHEGEIIGRGDDKEALLKLLLDIEFQSEENVTIIPIVGIGGLGKTALAQFVFNHEKVKNHFDLMMWVCISDVFDLKIIVANIIKSSTEKSPDQNLEMEQLQKQLRDKIDGKKYLLVLDDIWNEKGEQWFRLKKLLMGGARGSRIIVTTRSRTVANITSKCEPYVLKGLADDDAWSLFKKIADSTNPVFLKIGKEILGRCSGVPLVIRTIASTLSIKKTEDEWHSFKDNVLDTIISQKDGEIMPTLKLSYDHLPSHLKHCFAYSRLYPKDGEINVQTLVQLWIAQGFVKPSNPNQSLQEIGLEYFKVLVERSFFQEVGVDRERGMTCKMHDLMHDLAESVAGRECDILDSNRSEVDEICRHVSVDFSLTPLFKGKKLRTLLCLQNFAEMTDAKWDLIISNCRRLRALELCWLGIDTVPLSIYKLKHLRYLDLSYNHRLKFLPKSICKIQNLQMLKLDSCSRLEELPRRIEKLVNLTHLPCEECDSLTHMPPGIGKMTSLQALSLFVVDKRGSHGAAAADLSELSGLNNLRGNLRIKNLGLLKNAKEEFTAAKLKEKEHLRSLVLEWGRDVGDDEDKSLEDLQPHPNLKELKVAGWMGDAKFPSWLSLLTNLTAIEIRGRSKFKHLPSFAQLPHLQRLRIEGLTELEYMEVSGGEGESESLFPSLTSLTLIRCPNMKSWWRKRPIDDHSSNNGTTVIGASTTAFPCLSSLHIEDCPLASMPLYPSLDDRLLLVNTSSWPLKQTMQKNIAPMSTSSLPLSKLKYLELKNIEELEPDLVDESTQNKSLSGCLQQLRSLKRLTISNCKELDLEGMQWEPLKNLSHLEIHNIPQLEYMEDSDPDGRRGESEPFFPSLTSLTLVKCPNMKSWWRKRPIDDHNNDERTVIGTSSMAFPCLSRLHIEDCPLTSMPLYPSLDNELRLVNTSSRPLKQTIQMNITPSTSSLPLSKLKSFHVKNIEELDPDILDENKSLSVCLQQLTSLKSSKISDCKEIDLQGMQWESLKNLSDLEIDNIPQMLSLPLSLQHLVQLKTLKIKNCSGLKSLFPVFQHLTSLERFEIFNCEELELSAAGIQIFQDHTSLHVLHLENIPKCHHLPEGLQHLTNLKHLNLIELPNLTSLPDELRCLTSLEALCILRIPQLEERCRKVIGADWHKIAHIPKIVVTGRLVQWPR